MTRAHFAAAFAKSPAFTKLIFASAMCFTSAALISAGVRLATIDSSSASHESVRLMYETVLSLLASEGAGATLAPVGPARGPLRGGRPPLSSVGRSLAPARSDVDHVRIRLLTWLLVVDA